VLVRFIAAAAVTAATCDPPVPAVVPEAAAPLPVPDVPALPPPPPATPAAAVACCPAVGPTTMADGPAAAAAAVVVTADDVTAAWPNCCGRVFGL